MKKLALISAALLAGGAFAVESVPGVRGNAVRIDGRKAFLVDPENRPFDYSRGMTVGLFIRAEEWAQKASILTNAGSFSLTKRTKNTKGFYFSGTIGGKPDCAVVWSPEKFPAPLNKWVHIAVAYDPTTGIGTGYVNGRKVADYDVKTAVKVKDLAISGSSLKSMRFALGGGGVPYLGELDEVYIYGRVLTAAEVRDLAGGKAPEGALAAYKMDDSANPGLDSSGNGRNLTVEEGFLAQPPPRTGSQVQTDYLFKDQNIVIWGRPATARNMPADAPLPQQLSTTPLASLAANEYESFQIAVSTPHELKELQLELSPLTLDGETLAATIATVNYVAIPTVSQTVVQQKNAVFGEAATAFNTVSAQPGFYPDVLRPSNCFSVAPEAESSAFWITVKSTSVQKPGIYRGTGTLTADNGLNVEFPVAVEVWGFALPEQFHSQNSGVARDTLGTDSTALYRNCSEHHVSVTPLRQDVKITVGADDTLAVDTADFDAEARKALDQYHFSVLYFPGWGFYNMPRAHQSGADWHGVQIQQDGKLTERFKKVFGEYLRRMSAHLEKNGWLDKTRITLVDEPWTDGDFQLCQEFFQLVRANAPRVKVMVTKWPQPKLNGAPDIWCLGFFHHQDMRAARERGEKLEWYPNWHVLIDRPLMDSRMIGFLMWKYQITGILFWELNHGWSNKRNLEAPRFVYPDGRVICGSGLLIYPDDKNNPVSSVRWEMCRDAFEDFEYFYLLDELCKRKEDTSEAKAARELMTAACDAIVENYEAVPPGQGYGWKETVWEFDAQKLQDYRVKIAQMILKLQAKEN